MESLLHDYFAVKLKDALLYTNTYDFFMHNLVYIISLYLVIILTIYYFIWTCLVLGTNMLNPYPSIKDLHSTFNICLFTFYNILTVIVFLNGLLHILHALEEAEKCKDKNKDNTK
jgi:hypothetical protein